MRCAKCGTELRKGAAFCGKCGEKVSGAAAAANASMGKIEQSTNAIKKMNGYYCLNCGNYIHTNQYSFTVKCNSCNSPIVNPDHLGNAINSFVNYGVLGSLLAEGMNALSPQSQMSNSNGLSTYYSSSYYNQTGIPAEVVVADKGLIGEYLASVQFDKVKAALQGRSLYTFYNVVIPEPNGSFQEIDAMLIYGNHIFVIEAKNRDGHFGFRNWTDMYWTQNIGGQQGQVYSPFRQNQEHIAALNHYLGDLGPICSLYNVVALSNFAQYSDVSFDTFDRITYGAHALIANVQVLGQFLIETIREIENESCAGGASLQDTIDNGCLSSAAAKKIIDRLKPQLNLTENEKSILFRDRTIDAREHRKTEYRYYYVEQVDGTEDLYRTNGVYLEQLSRWGSWLQWDDAPVKLGNDGWPYRVGGGLRVVANIEHPSAIVCVAKAICNRERVDLDNIKIVLMRKYDSSANQNSGSNTNENSSRRNSDTRSGASQNQSNSNYRFFQGCDSEDKVKERYKNLCKTFHPDGGSGDEETFKYIQQEYDEILKSMQKSKTKFHCVNK